MGLIITAIAVMDFVLRLLGLGFLIIAVTIFAVVTFMNKN